MMEVNDPLFKASATPERAIARGFHSPPSGFL